MDLDIALSWYSPGEWAIDPDVFRELDRIYPISEVIGSPLAEGVVPRQERPAPETRRGRRNDGFLIVELSVYTPNDYANPRLELQIRPAPGSFAVTTTERTEFLEWFMRCSAVPSNEQLSAILHLWLDAVVRQYGENETSEVPPLVRISSFDGDPSRLESVRRGAEVLLRRIELALEEELIRDVEAQAELLAVRDVLLATLRNPNPNPVVFEASASDAARLLRDVTTEPGDIATFLSGEGIPDDVVYEVEKKIDALLDDVSALDADAPDGGLTGFVQDVVDIGSDLAEAAADLAEPEQPDHENEEDRGRTLKDAVKHGTLDGVEEGVRDLARNAIGKALPAALIALVVFVANAAAAGGLLSSLIRILIAILRAAG